MTQQENLGRFRIGIFDKSLNVIIKPDTDYDVIDSKGKNGKNQYHFVIYGDFSIDENGNYIKDKYGKYIKKELLRKLIDPKYEDAYSYDEWFSSKMEFCFGDFYWIREYPENFTLLQCTGLKDKNGKLIYEGDIVEGNEKIWEIRWKNCCLGFVDVKCKYQAHWELRADTEGTDYVILGNIHTHPELLTAIETGEEIRL